MDSYSIWLCVLTKANFELLKKERLYGVPNNKRSYEQLRRVHKGDTLLFYAISPVRRFLGISIAASEVLRLAYRTMG